MALTGKQIAEMVAMMAVLTSKLRAKRGQRMGAAWPQRQPHLMQRGQVAKGDGKALGNKFFKKMDKWNGVQGTWQAWKFQVAVAVGAVDPKIVKVMEKFQNN